MKGPVMQHRFLLMGDRAGTWDTPAGWYESIAEATGVEPNYPEVVINEPDLIVINSGVSLWIYVPQR